MSDVNRGLARLLDGWCSGQQLLDATGRNNANGMARDCRAAAARLGLRWLTLDVNQAGDGSGNHHRLWLCLERGEPIPLHPAMAGGAKPQEDWRPPQENRLTGAPRSVPGGNPWDQGVAPVLEAQKAVCGDSDGEGSVAAQAQARVEAMKAKGKREREARSPLFGEKGKSR